MAEIFDEVELYSMYVLFLGKFSLGMHDEKIVATEGFIKCVDLDGSFYGDSINLISMKLSFFLTNYWSLV